jgi:hypothetical protein
MKPNCFIPYSQSAKDRIHLTALFYFVGVIYFRFPQKAKILINFQWLNLKCLQEAQRHRMNFLIGAALLKAAKNIFRSKN